MNFTIETLIAFYTTIFVFLILFNAVYSIMAAKGMVIRHAKLGRCIEQIVRNNEPVSAKHINIVRRKCRNCWYLADLEETLLRLRPEYPKKTAEYIQAVTPAFVYLAAHVKKDDIVRAHFASVVGELGVSTPEIREYLLLLITSKQFHCRQNALIAVCKIGDADSVMRSLLLMDTLGNFMNGKIITDILVTFPGDKEELARILWSERLKVSLDMQLDFVNFARLVTGRMQREMLEVLQDAHEDDEMHFAAMRYLTRYPLDEAKPVLLKFTEETNDLRWEYTAIAASALSAYPGEDTVSALKKTISSPNWYVRRNTAQTLESLGISAEDAAEIIDGDDRYAREILAYWMQRKIQKMSEAVV